MSLNCKSLKMQIEIGLQLVIRQVSLKWKIRLSCIPAEGWRKLPHEVPITPSSLVQELSRILLEDELKKNPPPLKTPSQHYPRLV